MADLDPDVAALLEGPPTRQAPPNHRALLCDVYEPGKPERDMVGSQRDALAASGQLPRTAVFVPPDEPLRLQVRQDVGGVYVAALGSAPPDEDPGAWYRIGTVGLDGLAIRPGDYSIARDP